jgi:hypothetical protein
MFYFILALILVFIGVDLLVRLVIDPLATKTNKKNKTLKSYTPRFDPTLKLASETLYDGGELHKEDSSTKENSISKDANSNPE